MVRRLWYHPLVTAEAQKVLEDALSLPEAERVDLVASLLESLEGHPDAEHDAAWSSEISRRVDELESGSVDTVPWSEARRAILGGADGPSSG